MKAGARAGKRFAICIRNRGCEDLQVGKVYEVWAGRVAAAGRHLRVLDDSGEDYLYPAQYFVFVDLPPKVRRALTATRRHAASYTA
jgi:hypothetical protein